MSQTAGPGGGGGAPPKEPMLEVANFTAAPTEQDIVEFVTPPWIRKDEGGGENVRSSTPDVGAPARRYRHTCVAVDNRTFIVFGGEGARVLNDTFEFDIPKQQWTRLRPAGEAPSSRSGHSAIIHKSKIIVFGGEARYPTNDVYALDVNDVKWSRMLVSGTPPAARAGHSAVKVGDVMVVYGGSTGPTGPNGDVFFLSLENLNEATWTQPKVGGEQPLPRAWHSACALDNERMIVIGGAPITKSVEEVWILQSTPTQWESAKAHGQAPPPRLGHTVTKIGPNKVLLFGGSNPDEGTISNDIHILDTISYTWTKPVVNGESLIPPPRYGHTSMWLNDTFYVFGGQGSREYFGNLFTAKVSTVPAESAPAQLQSAMKSTELWVTVHVKLSGWKFLDFTVRIPLKSCVFDIRSRIVEQHGGSVGELVLYHERVSEDTIVSDMFTTLEKMGVKGDERNGSAETTFHYDFVAESSNPLLLITPR